MFRRVFRWHLAIFDRSIDFIKKRGIIPSRRVQLVEAIVQSRIDSGQGVITMIDDTTAEDMAAVLRGEADCSLLEPPLGN